eukprot:NODE_1376_length_1985_cov_32.462943_g1165_i0.p1 GENE.NODE_1376_length_1985_cov_32.462943_g1165_i0~~NODE_1376_length_1985_cov_32.462943_g1165_i0.p1  ORF type:complete len:507 (-),score=93.38 NODE_1376_length_1985_cov_32.462943_g1165_i0:371-1891(-)
MPALYQDGTPLPTIKGMLDNNTVPSISRSTIPWLVNGGNLRGSRASRCQAPPMRDPHPPTTQDIIFSAVSAWASSCTAQNSNFSTITPTTTNTTHNTHNTPTIEFRVDSNNQRRTSATSRTNNNNNYNKHTFANSYLQGANWDFIEKELLGILNTCGRPAGEPRRQLVPRISVPIYLSMKDLAPQKNKERRLICDNRFTSSKLYKKMAQYYSIETTTMKCYFGRPTRSTQTILSFMDSSYWRTLYKAYQIALNKARRILRRRRKLIRLLRAISRQNRLRNPMPSPDMYKWKKVPVPSPPDYSQTAKTNDERTNYFRKLRGLAPLESPRDEKSSPESDRSMGYSSPEEVSNDEYWSQHNKTAGHPYYESDSGDDRNWGPDMRSKPRASPLVSRLWMDGELPIFLCNAKSEPQDVKVDVSYQNVHKVDSKDLSPRSARLTHPTVLEGENLDFDWAEGQIVDTCSPTVLSETAVATLSPRTLANYYSISRNINSPPLSWRESPTDEYFY